MKNYVFNAFNQRTIGEKLSDVATTDSNCNKLEKIHEKKKQKMGNSAR